MPLLFNTPAWCPPPWGPVSPTVIKHPDLVTIVSTVGLPYSEELLRSSQMPGLPSHVHFSVIVKSVSPGLSWYVSRS